MYLKSLLFRTFLYAVASPPNMQTEKLGQLRSTTPQSISINECIICATIDYVKLYTLGNIVFDFSIENCHLLSFQWGEWR